MQNTILALNSPFFWIAMLLTVGCLSLLIYFYLGKDIKITIFLDILIVAFIFLMFGYDMWGHYLQVHFIGMFDEQGIPYRVSRPGWLGLLDAWPLWIVPAILLAGLSVAAVFMLHKQASKSVAPLDSVTANTIESAQKIQALERALAAANERLSQKPPIIITETATAPQRTQGANTATADQIKMLELERDIHLEEKQALAQQVEEQAEELSRLRALIEKVVSKK